MTEQDNAPTMRDKALALARMGFAVFPLKPLSKTPAVKRFYEAASSDLDKVAAMWTGSQGESLNNNIGISTDTLCVLDIDNKNGSNCEAALEKLVAEYELDLDTPTTLTPTGGKHLFYRVPPGMQVANTVGKLGPGIDTRGYHGYVVGPGSIVAKGEYRWLRSPNEQL